MRLLVTALALSFALPASATDLAWSWEEGQHRRFFLQSGIKFQVNYPMGAAIKYDFSAQDLLISMIVDCEAVELRKKRTDLTCTIEDIGLMAGAGNAASAGAVQAVLDEWKEKLTGARLVTSMTPQGRLGSSELEGVEYSSENRRTNAIVSGMETVLDRALAPLDVGLPKAGADWKEGWVAKNQWSMFIPSNSGGNGANKVKFTVDNSEDTWVDAVTEGHGTIMEGVDAATPKAYAFESEGILRFDHAQGTVVAHVYRSTGTLTAGSVSLPQRQTGEQQRTNVSTTQAGDTFQQGSRELGAYDASASGSGDGAFLRGGAYDPDSYLEVGRVYLLGPDDTTEVGHTGPMLYPTADPADPAAAPPKE